MFVFLADYGVFLLKIVTVAAIVVAAFVFILSAARKPHEANQLSIENINEALSTRTDAMRRAILGKRESRKLLRERKKSEKQKKESGEQDKRQPRIFVLDFKGDIRATATASLREEVSAILKLAETGDEVLLRLENAGGAVHEHGLAASQLLRLRVAGVKLTIAVDTVAASGGYLMACAADHIIAAPFAIVGSIGVVVQLPNFHRLLEDKGVDFEQITAGKYKRTLTVFGENTEEGREKMKEDLAEVHQLFQQRIAELRPSIDLDQVATGEYWYGSRALELNLVDELGTSDDFLLQAAERASLFRISYKRQKRFLDRLLHGAESLFYR